MTSEGKERRERGMGVEGPCSHSTKDINDRLLPSEQFDMKDRKGHARECQ